MGDELYSDILIKNFQLMHVHGWNIEYIESMLPLEFNIYLALLEQHLNKERDSLGEGS